MYILALQDHPSPVPSYIVYRLPYSITIIIYCHFYFHLNIALIIATMYADRQVCNRWLLAYTLLRNPSLASSRRFEKKTKPSVNPVNTTPAVFISEEEGSLNSDEHQEGQSNLNHSLTDLENNSGSPVCGSLQQLDGDVTNTDAHIDGAATNENRTELEVKTLLPCEVDMDEDHLILVDFDKGANCQSIERSECAKPDATDERSVNSQSPAVLPVAESICVVEPVDMSKIISLSEPLNECGTFDESEVRSSNSVAEEMNSVC